MPSSVKEMLAEASAAVPRLPPPEARALMTRGNVLIVDVRDPSEVQASGKIKGAVNVSRGMLEFRADPESPYHNPAFQKNKTVLVYCASGGRSALVGKTCIRVVRPPRARLPSSTRAKGVSTCLD